MDAVVYLKIPAGDAIGFQYVVVYPGHESGVGANPARSLFCCINSHGYLDNRFFFV